MILSQLRSAVISLLLTLADSALIIASYMIGVTILEILLYALLIVTYSF